jgi:hypothetical protein
MNRSCYITGFDSMSVCGWEGEEIRLSGFEPRTIGHVGLRPLRHGEVTLTDGLRVCGAPSFNLIRGTCLICEEN